MTLTYGAKHVGMEYERPLFGMKMTDAKIFSECLKITQSLVYLSLPGNLIDDDLISILIKGLVLNKTISQLTSLITKSLTPVPERSPSSCSQLKC